MAILCNHQRSVPKAFDSQMQKLVDKLDELKENIEVCRITFAGNTVEHPVEHMQAYTLTLMQAYTSTLCDPP